MSVTETLQKPGRFNVRLRDDAPYSVRSAIGLFDHIVITPVPLYPLSEFTDARILDAAIYTGVVTGQPTPYDIDGQGLEFWLGADDGRGDLLDTAVTNTAGSLSTWITSLRPSSLSAGTVTNTGTGTLTYSYQWSSRREALDHMLRAVGAERRINPDFTLDAALATTLFVSTPTAVITRNPESRDAIYDGIESTQVNAAIDADGYTTKVIVVGKTGDGAAVATGSATGSNVYKDGLNNNVVLERFANAPTEPATNVTAYATSLLALYSSTRRTFSLSSRTYAVPIRVKPGDWVWVYDPDAGFVDSANQITWRGELITPVKLRCKGYTWPIQRGMGVYARRSGATPTYTDLTDYIEWDTADTTWEIGTSATDPDQDPSQLGSAYLGVHPEILNRATQQPVIRVRARRAAVTSIPNNSESTITFDTEDSDTYGMIAVPATTFTVPAGMDTREWTITLNVTFATSISARTFCSIAVASSIANVPGHFRGIGSYDNECQVMVKVPLAAGDTIAASVYQNSGAAQNMTACWFSAVADPA